MNERGLSVLGLIVVVFLLVVVALGGIAVIMVTRAGGINRFTADYAAREQSAADVLTPAGMKVANRNTFDAQEVLSIDDPSFGNPQAKLTIVQFGDFQCEHTRDAFPVMREVMTKYKNDIRFIYRDFPILSHPDAAQAAEASQCAWAQDRSKFWGFHDKLFQNQEDLTLPALQRYAVAVGLDDGKLAECIQSHRFQKEVEHDLRAGVDLGVPGTPTYFIVYGKNVQRIAGIRPFGFWKELIEMITTTRDSK